MRRAERDGLGTRLAEHRGNIREGPHPVPRGERFGPVAARVADRHEIRLGERLQSMGYTINRPPRDGHMAFVRSPDLISVELLQEGHLPPKEPWVSMPNTGSW